MSASIGAASSAVPVAIASALAAVGSVGVSAPATGSAVSRRRGVDGLGAVVVAQGRIGIVMGHGHTDHVLKSQRTPLAKA